MFLLIDVAREETEATYQVAIDQSLLAKSPKSEAWDMLREKSLENNTDGQFDLAVPAWGVSVFMVGAPAALKPIKALQTELNKKDLSVPKYFRDRPQLNEGEYNTPVPAPPDEPSQP
jgi:hypothetical protein